MPPSRVKPEDTYEAFHTDETFTAVARRFGVVRLTLKRWWILRFGKEAFQQKKLSERSKLQRVEKRRDVPTSKGTKNGSDR
jgi:transposase-like protein